MSAIEHVLWKYVQSDEARAEIKKVVTEMEVVVENARWLREHPSCTPSDRAVHTYLMHRAMDALASPSPAHEGGRTMSENERRATQAQMEVDGTSITYPLIEKLRADLAAERERADRAERERDENWRNWRKEQAKFDDLWNRSQHAQDRAAEMERALREDEFSYRIPADGTYPGECPECGGTRRSGHDRECVRGALLSPPPPAHEEGGR